MVIHDLDDLGVPLRLGKTPGSRLLNRHQACAGLAQELWSAKLLSFLEKNLLEMVNSSNSCIPMWNFGIAICFCSPPTRWGSRFYQTYFHPKTKPSQFGPKYCRPKDLLKVSIEKIVIHVRDICLWNIYIYIYRTNHVPKIGDRSLVRVVDS